MALGYEIGTIMKRNSIIHSDDSLTIKLDTIEGLGPGFVQVTCCWVSWVLLYCISLLSLKAHCIAICSCCLIRLTA